MWSIRLAVEVEHETPIQDGSLRSLASSYAVTETEVFGKYLNFLEVFS